MFTTEIAVESLTDRTFLLAYKLVLTGTNRLASGVVTGTNRLASGVLTSVGF